MNDYGICFPSPKKNVKNVISSTAKSIMSNILSAKNFSTSSSSCHGDEKFDKAKKARQSDFGHYYSSLLLNCISRKWFSILVWCYFSSSSRAQILEIFHVWIEMRTCEWRFIKFIQTIIVLVSLAKSCAQFNFIN